MGFLGAIFGAAFNLAAWAVALALCLLLGQALFGSPWAGLLFPALWAAREWRKRAEAERADRLDEVAS